MPTDNVHAAVADEIVAAGPGENGLHTGPASEIPDFQGAIVAAGHHAVRAGKKLTGQDLAGMSR